MRISLPGWPSHPLVWEEELKEAEDGEGPLIWEFDLAMRLPLDDPMEFHARALALETFAKEVYPRFQERTEAIVLYRGSLDWSHRFFWDLAQEDLFSLWRADRPDASLPHLKRLFYADRLAYALQMFAHKLPDEVPIRLELSPDLHLKPAERAQLHSKERFEHFELPPKKEEKAGVCFPEEEMCSGELLEAMDSFFSEIPAPFRVMEERFLTEEWEGLEELYVLSSSISPRGKRKLAGFLAAGGALFVKGRPLGLEGEREFRGRGI